MYPGIFTNGEGDVITTRQGAYDINLIFIEVLRLS